MIKCTYEDGNVVPLRHVTVDAIIEKQGKLLLIKRSVTYHIEPGKFALPGGFLDRDESCDEAVEREVLEETGYESTSTTLFRIADKPRLLGDDRQNVGFFYIVTVGEIKQQYDNEVMSIHWFPLDTLPNSESIGFDHMQHINLFKEYRQKPFPLPKIN